MMPLAIQPAIAKPAICAGYWKLCTMLPSAKSVPVISTAIHFGWPHSQPATPEMVAVLAMAFHDFRLDRLPVLLDVAFTVYNESLA